VNDPGVGLVVAAMAATGTYLLWSASALAGAPRPRTERRRWWPRRVPSADLVAAVLVVGGVAAALTYVVLGAAVPAILVGAASGAFPAASRRRAAAVRAAAAHEAWPRLIEELRLLTGAVGRSIPQALFDVGGRGPVALRPAFDAAHREWLLSTDFERTLRVLRHGLADPTADAACETLLVAHELGGTDLERRLLALAEDRALDVQGRRDARARQAGVRFARRFVLVVPAGMAVAGLAIGDGRAAYASPAGQALVSVAVAATVACWWWAGRLLRLPGETRVFAS
jgi:tight adherence protein B